MCGLGHKWGIYTGRHINLIREVFPVTPANHVTGPATEHSRETAQKNGTGINLKLAYK